MQDRMEQKMPPSRRANVLRFRPRTSDSASRHETPSAVAKAGDNAQDDFRHRMMVNAAGFAFAVLLTTAGIWLAFQISDLRQTQDCVLTGRRDCAPIVAVDKQSLPLRQH